MATFQNRDNTVSVVPEGDYKFVVIGCECGMSATDKTRGSDRFELKLQTYFKDKKLGPVVKEILVDHESIGWKLDTFIRCCGVDIKLNENWTFNQGLATRRKMKWVNPYGLTGICRLFQDEYNGKKFMKVAMFYTDKTKFPRDESVKPPADSPDAEPEPTTQAAEPDPDWN